MKAKLCNPLHLQIGFGGDIEINQRNDDGKFVTVRVTIDQTEMLIKWLQEALDEAVAKEQKPPDLPPPTEK